MQDLSAADSATGAQYYKLSESSSKGSASSDKWADSASSTGGLEGLVPTLAALSANPHPPTAALPSAQLAGAPRSRGPSSVASAEPGWEVLIGDMAKKRKGRAHSVAASSKASRVSDAAFSNASGFFKKPPASSQANTPQTVRWFCIADSHGLASSVFRHFVFLLRAGRWFYTADSQEKGRQGSALALADIKS